jgi:hypothetical protein
MARTDDAFLYRWLDQVKSPDGPPDPVLRLICLLVGSWMKNKDAPEAQVGLGTIGDQAGLKKRALRDRIRQLEGVWLDIDRPAGRRPIFRLRVPAQGEAVPSLEDVRSGAAPDVENSPTPAPSCRGVRILDPGTVVPGWAAPPFRGPRHHRAGDTYSLPTSDLGAGAGGGAPEGPAGAAPGPEGEQLPMPRLLSRFVEVGKEGDQAAVEDAIRQMKEAARG